MLRLELLLEQLLHSYLVFVFHPMCSDQLQSNSSNMPSVLHPLTLLLWSLLYEPSKLQSKIEALWSQKLSTLPNYSSNDKKQMPLVLCFIEHIMIMVTNLTITVEPISTVKVVTWPKFCPYIIYMNLDQSKQTNIIENNLSIANIKYLCL